MRKGKTTLMIFKGGPFDGKKKRMETCGTFEFRLGEFKGYYDASNKWISTK